MHYDSRTPSSSHTTVYVNCDCGNEIIAVEWDRGEKLVNFSLYEGRIRGRSPLARRVRHIWRIVRRGDPWGDWAILNPNQALLLADTLNKFVASTVEPPPPDPSA